ncbi:MAG: DUF1829 domain-containing protein [Candidatus Eremiobacteraeota bacterium]|nr:DUF1829 domain-containing protein [Candidatus Eremiobacteraeota bacterium]
MNDLFVMAAPMVASIFRDDVEKFLLLKEIRFTPSVKFAGKTGFDHSFDFVIPASKSRPERILRAINQPDRQKISMLNFSWIDTREVRPPGSVAYGVLNDREKEVSVDLIEALRSYGIKPILWTEREKYTEELAT